MKKQLTLPSVALAGGAVAFVLRLMQNRTGFDPDTGLPIPGSVPGIALVLLLAGMAALLLWMTRALPASCAVSPAFPAAFSTEDTGMLMVPMAGAFLVALSGILDLLLGFGFLASTSVTLPGFETFSLFAGDAFSPVSHLLLGAVSLIAAVPLLLMILSCRRGGKREVRVDGCVLLVPVLTLVVRLVLTYRVDSVDPSLAAYYVEVLTLVFLILGFYRLSSFAFGAGRIRPFSWCVGAAAVLTLTILADTDAPLASTLLYLGSALVLLGELLLLLAALPESDR